LRLVALGAEATCQHALHVAIQDRLATAEGKGGNGGGSRRPDARQPEKAVNALREGAAFHYDARRVAQVPPARVIAQAAPEPQHLVLGSSRERCHVREARKETLVIGDHRGNLGLLQHDFREPDAVRIACVLPWQAMPAVAALPEDQFSRECRHAADSMAR
jgi:hypothetical protein